MNKPSRKTITRVLLYIRTLESLLKEKHYLVSSKQLSDITGLSDVQIRKDISSFGKVGKPRLGYKTVDLKNKLKDFLLQDNIVHLVLFGVGNLGSAMLKYPGFEGRIRLVAAFDISRDKIGRKINGVKIYHINRAPEIIKSKHADIGIIAVPASCSQDVADLMVLSGLQGIINFSPISLSTPKNVRVKDIDFTIEFLSLFCNTQILGSGK